MSIISSTISHGITLAASGAYTWPLTVTSSGYVYEPGTANAIYGPSSSAWSIANYGTVAATGNGDGVKLSAGGNVSNGISGSNTALISSARNGVYIAGTSPGTVSNDGTITATYGVRFGKGQGVVVNGGKGATGALISAGRAGVLSYAITSNQLAIANYGTISATGAYSWGVLLPNVGGRVVNGASGATRALISGVDAGVGVNTYSNPRYASGPVTITNYGTIRATGSHGDGVDLGLGGELVLNGPGRATTALIYGVKVGVFTYYNNYRSPSDPKTIANYGTIIGGNEGVVFQGFSRDLLVNGGTGASGALISGSTRGVVAFAPRLSGTTARQPAPILNYGTIVASGSAGIGVDLGNGGTLINGSSVTPTGLIGGSLQGIAFEYTAGTVANFATVANMTTGVGGDAIYLGAGGTVTNYGLISGAALPKTTGTTTSFSGAIEAKGTPTTVRNFGTIAALGTADGVLLLADGMVVNGSAGSSGAEILGTNVGIYISGTYGINPIQHVAGTVLNYGTVSSTGTGAAVQLPGGLAINRGLVSGAGGISAGRVTNYGTVVATAAAANAVYLYDGGLVNRAAGLIVADQTAVNIAGIAANVLNYGTIVTTGTGIVGRGISSGTATVANHGTVSAGNGAGIYFTGGTITNAPGAVISGATAGIHGEGIGFAVANTSNIITNGSYGGSADAAAANGGSGAAQDAAGVVVYSGFTLFNYSPHLIPVGVNTVANRGTIEATGSGGVGIVLSSGTILNGASGATGGLITGAYAGVEFQSYPSTLTNFGTIAASNGTGVILNVGGTVTNGDVADPNALISAAEGVGISIAGSAGTVIDAGTITGASTAISFGGTGGNLLALEQGYKLGGVVIGSTIAGASTTLELAGSALHPLTVDYNRLRLSNFQDILFGPSGYDVLKASNTAGTLGVISGFNQTSEIIDLTAIGANGTITNFDLMNNRITVTGSSGAVTLQLDASDSNVFITKSDQANGTDLTIGLGSTLPPADFDGDGHVDVLWHNPTNGDTGYWVTGGNGDVTSFHDFGLGATTYAVVGVGDFDGKPDVLWHNPTNGDTGYWVTGSNGDVTGFHDFGDGATTYAVAAVGDFDGKPDVLWHNPNNGDTGYWVTDSSGAVTGFHDFGFGATTYALEGVGDFDGKPDVWWHNPTNGDTGYWVTDSSGTVTGFHDFGDGATMYSIAGIGDFDGSGEAEILWHNSTTGDTGYWVTDSSGTVTGFHDFGFGDISYSIAAIGDYDGSGRPEILWHNSTTGDTGYWVADSSGTVTGFHDFGKGATTYGVV